MLQGNVKDLQDADESMKQQIDVLNGEIETVKGQIADLNSQISTLEDELNKKIDEAVKELEAADLANSQRISDLESSLEDLQKELAAAKEELNGVIAELKEAIAAGDDANKALIDELTKKLNDLTQTVSDLSEQVKDNYDKLLAEIEKAVTELEAADAAAAQRIDGILEDIEGINGELTSLKEDLAEQTQKLADLIETVAGLEEAVDILEGLTANLPELEDLVDSIENNYLSKEEAQNTYATLEQVEKLLEQIGEIDGRLDMLEGLNIGERLTDLEANYKDLNDVVIPGLKDDILAAQNAADEAQKAADAAMDFAKDVLGQLETLRNALGIYAEAGALEAKMEALEKMDSTLAAKTEELAGFILDLEESVAGIEETLSTVTNQITELTNSIEDLRKEVFEAIDKIQEAMVTKDEFGKFFNDELTKVLAEDGAINEAIKNAIEKASDELQGNIDSINKKIDEEIMPLIKDLTQDLEDLTDDTNKIVGDLADNIQSLVFVPEYKNDNMATAYFSYVGKPLENETVYDYGLYDGQKQRVFATFQVTPQNIAESITVDNAALQVMPVKTRNFADGEIEYIKGDDLIITHGPDGRIYVDALVSAECQDNFAIALYVADENIISEGNFADIDAGEYVTSDYARVKLDEDLSNLTERYVLYNPETDEEYPEDEGQHLHLVNGLNEIQKPWTDAPGTVAFYEGYELYLNLGTDAKPDYRTLAEVEEEFRLDAGALTPLYNAASVATPETGAITYVPDVEKGYGFIVSMPEPKEEAVKFVGATLVQRNFFEKNGVNVIENTTSYEITNKRYVLDFEDQRLDWTYDLAKEYTIITGNNPYDNAGYSEKPYEFKEVDVDETSGALGEDGYKNINDIINSGIAPTTKVTRFDGVTSKVPQDVTSTFVVQIDVLASQVDQIATVTMDEYHFTKGHDAVYHVEQTYVDNKAHVEVVITFDLTLGAAPADKKIELGDYKINFVTTGQKCSYTELNVNPIEQAYPGDEYFGAKGIEVFTESLRSRLAGAMYSRNWHTERLEEPENVIWDYTSYTYKVSEPLGNISTFIGILDETGDSKEPEEGYYIRTSGADITKFGDQFDLTTTITTWYGIEYTFHATSTIEVPAFKLIYDPLLAPNGTAILEGSLYGKKYDFPTVDLTNYVQMENADEAAGTSLWIEFKFVTKEDSEKGILNLPNGGQNLYSPHDGKGNFAPMNIDWGKYTARELEFEAILWLTTGSGNDVEVNRLPLKVITDDPISFSAETRTITDRVSGEDYKINLWEQLVINGVLDGDKNIAMYYGEKDPREYEQFANVVADMPGNLLFKYLIDGEEPTAITFGTPSYKVLDGGYTNAYVNYDAATGVLTYLGENGVLQNDLVITVPVTLHHKLDYNKVEIKEANVTIIINKQIGE